MKSTAEVLLQALSSCSKSYSSCKNDTEFGMQQIKKSLGFHQTLDETDSAAKLDWELDYITEFLNSSQLMFQDFASSLFDEIEERVRGRRMSMKIERKALFTCVNQCLAVKCERMLTGRSCKGMMMMEHNRDLLAEEVNREVKALKKMRER